MTTNFERKSSEPRRHTFLRSSLLVAEDRERTRLRSNTSKEAVNRRRRSLFRSSSTLYSVTLLLQFFFFAAHGLSSPPKKAEATKRASLSSFPILLVFFPPPPSSIHLVVPSPCTSHPLVVALDGTNQPGRGKPKKNGDRGERESRRNLNRPVKFISNRLILFRRSNFPPLLSFVASQLTAVSYAVSSFRPPPLRFFILRSLFFFPPKPLPLSQGDALQTLSLSLSLSSTETLLSRCVFDARVLSLSPRFVASFPLPSTVSRVPGIRETPRSSKRPFTRGYKSWNP